MGKAHNQDIATNLNLQREGPPTSLPRRNAATHGGYMGYRAQDQVVGHALKGPEP